MKLRVVGLQITIRGDEDDGADASLWEGDSEEIQMYDRALTDDELVMLSR